eukprot:gene4716-biopygen3212
MVKVLHSQRQGGTINFTSCCKGHGTVGARSGLHAIVVRSLLDDHPAAWNHMWGQHRRRQPLPDGHQAVIKFRAALRVGSPLPGLARLVGLPAAENAEHPQYYLRRRRRQCGGPSRPLLHWVHLKGTTAAQREDAAADDANPRLHLLKGYALPTDFHLEVTPPQDLQPGPALRRGTTAGTLEGSGSGSAVKPSEIPSTESTLPAPRAQKEGGAIDIRLGTVADLPRGLFFQGQRCGEVGGKVPQRHLWAAQEHLPQSVSLTSPLFTFDMLQSEVGSDPIAAPHPSFALALFGCQRLGRGTLVDGCLRDTINTV